MPQDLHSNYLLRVKALQAALNPEYFKNNDKQIVGIWFDPTGYGGDRLWFSEMNTSYEVFEASSREDRAMFIRSAYNN